MTSAWRTAVGLDIDDDRVVEIDQIVRGVGEERQAAVGAGPAGRRVRWRDELRCDVGRASERRVIEHGYVLVDRPARCRGRQSLRPLDATLPVSIGLDQAGVDREALAADQARRDAAAEDGLEHPAQEIALAEAAVPVLREGRMVRHVAIKPKPTKPPIGQREMNFLTKASL